MMTKGKSKGKRPGYGKILDSWVPPSSAGDPIGCVATSFTFSPVFFEEECLGRFLSMETDPFEDGALYLIEREEKLSQVVCAAALVDQHFCKGSRSLRWDLLPSRVAGGVLHAKVSLLHWAGWIRLIVSSANLTEDGYRRNQEVLGVLDYRKGRRAYLSVLEEALAFLKTVALTSQSGADAFPALERWNSFLDQIGATVAEWEIEDLKQGRKTSVYINPVFVGPGRKDVFWSLAEAWPSGTPPYRAEVVSPFFDSSGTGNKPVQRLWNILRRRGEAEAAFHVTAEEIQGEEGALLLHAPESLLLAQPSGRPGVKTDFHRIELEVNRPLHAKSIWLEDDRRVVYMMGSSNFTSQGLGLASSGKPKNPPGSGVRGNIEANLAYIVDKHRAPKAHKALRNSFLAGKKIKIREGIRWQPRKDEEEDSTGGEDLLPSAFGAAVYTWEDGGKGRVDLELVGNPPKGWALLNEVEEKPFFSEGEWLEMGSPESLSLDWPSHRPPSGFWVCWQDAKGRAWWPVNVSSEESLPPPEELKDLTVEALIDILTSARSLHQVLRKHLRNKQAGVPTGQVDPAATDPHRRVNTSHFLLQRTRRVSLAINALRERVERPVVSRACLKWRLRGPVGVTAMAEALVREAKSDEEKAFLLSELALELARARFRPVQGCLPVREIEEDVRKVIQELKGRIPRITARDQFGLNKYIENVFSTVLR